MIKIQIGIAGAAGRMGQMTLKEIMTDDDAACSGLLVRPGSPFEGAEAKLPDLNIGTGLKYSAEKAEVFENSDVVIDFSTREASLENAKAAANQRVPIAIGVTGFTEPEITALKSHANRIPILLSFNMSFGITALAHALQELSRNLGRDFHLQITDIHHKHKKDAPSGTALMLGEATGRDKKDIKYISERKGEVVGEHHILFSGPAEDIEITHKARDRSLFARDAVLAAKWLQKQKPGFYTLKDVVDQ